MEILNDAFTADYMKPKTDVIQYPSSNYKINILMKEGTKL